MSSTGCTCHTCTDEVSNTLWHHWLLLLHLDMLSLHLEYMNLHHDAVTEINTEEEHASKVVGLSEMQTHHFIFGYCKYASISCSYFAILAIICNGSICLSPNQIQLNDEGCVFESWTSSFILHCSSSLSCVYEYLALGNGAFL